jgi:predicted DNA-binding transcriptional regulator AlpA
MQQKYLSDSQLAARYSVSRATVWRWAKRGILPSPVQLSAGCTRWSAAQIEERDAMREKAGKAAA